MNLLLEGILEGISELTAERDVYEIGSTEETLQKEAKEKGCVLILPQPNQLLLDIDRPGAIIPKDTLKLVEAWWGVAAILRWDSRSGNSHFIVTLKKDVTKEERELLQVALGSDPKRGLLAARTLYEPDGEAVENAVPCCLFQPINAIITPVTF